MLVCFESLYGQGKKQVKDGMVYSDLKTFNLNETTGSDILFAQFVTQNRPKEKLKP